MHPDEEADECDTTELRINVLVLLAMTDKYDAEISDKMHTCHELDVVMPFGSPRVFQDVVKWLVYGIEPSEFVSYQRCAEFGRFYSISLPDHTDAEIVMEKLDDMGFPPPEPDPAADFGEDTIAHYEKVIHWKGRLYKRRYFSLRQNGCYYYCMSAADGERCKGSIFVSRTGEIRDVAEHDQACTESQLFTFDFSKWDEAEREIGAIAKSRPDITAWQVLKTLMEANEDLANCALQMPLAALLRYITSRYASSAIPLDTRMETQSGIMEKSIIYHEVYPSDFLIYSHRDIRKLANDVHWILVDGTFKACPGRFKQLLTVLARDEETGVFFPVIHALMPSRVTDSYMRFFEFVDQYFLFEQLAYITVDFERSLIQALRHWISKRHKTIEIIGCKFHYSKAITRHFKEKRKKLNKRDKEFLSAFYNLPFLKRTDIDNILDALNTVEHPNRKFVEYFKRTWMSGEMFDLWNLSDKQSEGVLGRYTNNAIESFHSRLGVEVSKHPQTQILLRFLERYAGNKLSEIGTKGRIMKEGGSVTAINRLEILFKWRTILEAMETRSEYCCLTFGFVCPTCGHTNQLQGRRASHLTCAEGCRHDKDIQKIVEEIQGSLLESFRRARLQDKMTATRAMSNLRYWFQTLRDGTVTREYSNYIKQMKKLITKTMSLEVDTTRHTNIRAPSARKTYGRPNRTARLLVGTPLKDDEIE